MTNVVRELQDRLPAGEDLLNAIGLQYQRTAMSALTTVTAFAVGALAGAVLATLFAPRPGSETRQELNDRMRAWGDRLGWGQPRAASDETAH
jgi:hypothetical protein